MIISTFTPWRPIAQGLPFLGLIISLFLEKHSKYLLRIIQPFVILFFLSILSAIFNFSPFVNLLFGIITWMGGIAAFITSYSAGKYIGVHKVLKMLIIVSLAQVPIGLYQVFSAVNFKLINPFTVSGSVGDYFSGTLFSSGVNSHITGLKLLFSLTLFFFAGKVLYSGWITRIIFLFALLIGWITPSAVHSFLCFILGVLSYLILERKVSKFRILLLAIFATFIIITMQEFTIGYIETLIKKSIIFSKETPHKVIALYETIILSFEKPSLLIVGLGLGQYSSYAAMILTGEMLRYNPWYIPISISKETERFILQYWNKNLLETDVWAHGVANQPWFTYMSIYGELGLSGLIIFIIFFLLILRKLRLLHNQSITFLERETIKALLIYTYFLLFLFFFDNWFEDARLMVPYFIVLGIVLKKSENYL